MGRNDLEDDAIRSRAIYCKSLWVAVAIVCSIFILIQGQTTKEAEQCLLWPDMPRHGQQHM